MHSCWVLILYCLVVAQVHRLFDRAKAEEEIMEMHDAQRTYHFGKDSVSLLSR